MSHLQEFIGALSTFSEKGNTEAKLKFAFQIYDMDGDGYISNGELFQVLKMMVGDNLNEVQLQQIVDKTILEADVDRVIFPFSLAAFSIAPTANTKLIISLCRMERLATKSSSR